MCIAADHLTKSRNNEDFLESIQDKYCDWKITVSFYSSLHLINAYLHNKKNAFDEDISGHDLLKDYLLSKGMPALHKEYLNFQRLSHAARYKFDNMEPQIVVANEYKRRIKTLCPMQ